MPQNYFLIYLWSSGLDIPGIIKAFILFPKLFLKYEEKIHPPHST